MNLESWSNAGYTIAALLFGPVGWILLSLANRGAEAVSKKLGNEDD